MTITDDEAQRLHAVKDKIRTVFGGWSKGTTIAEMRAEFDQMLASDRAATIEPLQIGEIQADRILANGSDGRTVLYFHGGGYQMGSRFSHRDLMIRLSEAGGADVIGFDYRLAPEHRFPASVQDGVAAYRWLLESGHPADSIAFAGDSAGAGLAVATLLAVREDGLPLPRAAVLLSPWLDMEATGETYQSRADVDPMTQRDKIRLMARAYLGRTGDPRDPLASPIHGDLAGLPPLLIHVGDHETILDDSRVFAERARAAGVPVTLTVFDEMIHHFQVFPELEASGRSLQEISAFLRDAWR
ncbi:alpha/beta hydrolase [Amorphus sp. 3PC139-8]|uniref:alpha/beta hydrolase n=1 Tax=Amorphus sp. 3PC139-8 TaxID=2735676 RepID=UPI00345C6C87